MQAILERFSARDLKLIFGGIVLLEAVALITYALWPQLQTYRAAFTSRATLEQVVARDSSLDAELTRLEQRVQTLQRKLQGDTADLPAKEVEAYIIGRLQRISWRNEVELVGVSPKQGEEIQSFKELLFEVELAGDYFDLFAWLEDAGGELGFVVVKKYEMAPIEQGKAPPRLGVKLTMALYRESA